MADSPFKLLIDTTALWLPALSWLVARLERDTAWTQDRRWTEGAPQVAEGS